MEIIASSATAAFAIISLSAAPLVVLLVAIIAARLGRDHNREGFSLLALIREIVFLSVALAASAFLASLAFSNLKSFLPENLTIFYPVQSVLYGLLYALSRPILSHIFREVEAMNDVMAGLQNDLSLAQQDNSRLLKLLANFGADSGSPALPGSLTVLPPADGREQMATAA